MMTTEPAPMFPHLMTARDYLARHEPWLLPMLLDPADPLAHDGTTALDFAAANALPCESIRGVVFAPEAVWAYVYRN